MREIGALGSAQQTQVLLCGVGKFERTKDEMLGVFPVQEGEESVSIRIVLNLLLFFALQWTTATNHALLYRLDVVFVVLIGSLLRIERIGWRELLLLAVMLFGIALVAEIGPSGFQLHIIGDLVVVGAAAAFAANAFVVRRVLRTMDVESVALWNVVITGFGFIGLMLARSELSTVGDALWSPTTWIWVGLLGLLFALFVPLYYATLNRMPVWKLRMWMLSAPVLVAVADWLIWDTRLTPLQWVSMGVVLCGLAGLIHLERNGKLVHDTINDQKTMTEDLP